MVFDASINNSAKGANMSSTHSQLNFTHKLNHNVDVLNVRPSKSIRSKCVFITMTILKITWFRPGFRLPPPPNQRPRPRLPPSAIPCRPFVHPPDASNPCTVHTCTYNLPKVRAAGSCPQLASNKLSPESRRRRCGCAGRLRSCLAAPSPATRRRHAGRTDRCARCGDATSRRRRWASGAGRTASLRWGRSPPALPASPPPPARSDRPDAGAAAVRRPRRMPARAYTNMCQKGRARLHSHRSTGNHMLSCL